MSDDTEFKNVFKLVPKQESEDLEEEFLPNPDVIYHLESLLERAKEGEITEVFIVSSLFDGIDHEASWVGLAAHPNGMVGAIENSRLQYQLWVNGLIEFEEE